MPGLPAAWLIAPEARARLTRSDIVGAGGLYVQNLSSQLAPAALGNLAGLQVLDPAAAPGGKTLDLLQRVGPSGHVAAVEPVRSRFFALNRNVDAARGWAGVERPTCRLFNADGRQVGRKTPGRFDRVMLDAPCSSEARIDPADAATLGFWSPAKVRECVRKQRALLASAGKTVAPGGLIAYCTCTINRAENEDIVERFLGRADGRFLPESVTLPAALPELDAWTPGPGMLRIRPNHLYPAFFIALLRRLA